MGVLYWGVLYGGVLYGIIRYHTIRVHNPSYNWYSSSFLYSLAWTLETVCQHQLEQLPPRKVFVEGDDDESSPITFVRGINLERLAIEGYTVCPQFLTGKLSNEADPSPADMRSWISRGGCALGRNFNPW